ncbi:MAG: reverse transcriptase/maturase family protein [Methylococcaceae bacterium]|nr:reverse transcriptase/maturase family protein [Methylococcaceae bacterium]
MRIVPRGSFERLSRDVALWKAYLACRKGKRRQPNMARFDLDADREIVRLHKQLADGCYRPKPWTLRVIHDPKTRLIAAPAIRDRIVHRALIDEIGEIYERSYIHHSYTAFSGRGPHRAALRFLDWMRRFGYRLHLDIQRYFPSIHHPTLIGLFSKNLRDPATLDLIADSLEHGRTVYDSDLARETLKIECYPIPRDRGLPLGSYLSQWSGTFYLNGLDHYVKRDLKIQAYLRYMDDFVLFSNSQAELEQTRSAIAEWLLDQRGLKLNPKHTDIVASREAAIFLGYRISRAGFTPGKKLRRSMKKRIRIAAAKGHEPLIRCLRSYRGLCLF